MSSYVTRRLLRSTLPETAEVAEVEPARRPNLRTRRDDKHKAARRVKAKEEGEHDENERAGGNEDGELEAAPQSEGREEDTPTDADAVDVSALHGFELLIDINYAKDLWAEARVLDLDVGKQEVFVHYMGWNARYDAWVAPKLIAAHGSRTKAATKKNTSWDGIRSLFEPAEGSTEGTTPRKKEIASKQRSLRRSATPKSKSDKRKRRGSACSAASGGSRSGSTPTSPQPATTNKLPVESSTVKDEGGAVVDVAPRVTRARASKASGRSNERDVEMPSARDRASPSNTRVVMKEESNGGAVCNEEEMPLAVATPAGDIANGGTGRSLRRQAGGKRRGRGRKGQVDESSESEYSDHEDSDMEEEGDASDEEEVWRLRKRRKQKEQGLSNDDDEEEASEGAAKGKRPATRRSERRTVNTKTHPLPQSAPRAAISLTGGGGATRERLAAIFRQRVYQQQLMQVTRAEMQAQQPPSGTAAAPMAPTPAASTAERTRPRRGANRNGSKANAAAPMAAPVAGPDPQLAAYYHYHNMMMAQAYMTADPKEIQERLRAIEQQRALQVQAYYRQLEATRAQNVQSIEDAQEFMAKSASAWQQQSLAIQSGSKESASADSASLKNWNDMAKSLENGKATATGDDSPRDASAQELVDAKGVVKTDEKKADASASQSDAALKHEPKAQSGEPDAPRGDILYEFVL